MIPIMFYCSWMGIIIAYQNKAIVFTQVDTISEWLISVNETSILAYNR